MDNRLENIIWKTYIILGTSTSAYGADFGLKTEWTPRLMLFEAVAIGCFVMGLLIWYKHFADIRI